MTSSGGDAYVLNQTEHDEELKRIRTIEANWDPKTRRHCLDLGLSPGWRCLDVGAGGGGVARWLAERVGPEGRVVAMDINTRYLEGARADNLEVRKSSIITDDIEEGAFDLVHCRMLLIHLRDPVAALEKMIRALRPGGALLVEEMAGMDGPADPSFPAAAECDAATAKHAAFLQAIGVDAAIGSRLPGMLVKLGLSSVSGERVSRVVRASDNALRIGTTNALRRVLVEKGVASDAELDRYIEMLRDPDFLAIEPPVISVWGRKPD